LSSVTGLKSIRKSMFNAAPKVSVEASEIDLWLKI
jgi:hypothetical protein